MFISQEFKFTATKIIGDDSIEVYDLLFNLYNQFIDIDGEKVKNNTK